MAFKMKKFSGFKQAKKTLLQLPKIHKSQKSKLPTKKEAKISKGTVKGLTGFEYDFVKPIISNPRRMNRKLPELLKFSKPKVIKKVKTVGQKIKKYFTER